MSDPHIYKGVLYVCCLFFRQADNLWRELSTVDDVNTAVSLWLLTLEKQVCS